MAEKVIFLDIDGVLNTHVYAMAFWDICKRLGFSRADARILAKRERKDEYGHLFDPLAVSNLKYIIEETGAKIVLSTTWRKSGLALMQEMWEMRDLPGEVIDATPILNTPRGEEIAEWLRENEVESYIIIDDNSDMLPEQQPFFIHTDSLYGLTQTDAKKGVEILGKIQELTTN